MTFVPAPASILLLAGAGTAGVDREIRARAVPFARDISGSRLFPRAE